MENSRRSIAWSLIVCVLVVLLVVGGVVASAALSWRNVPMVGASAGSAGAQLDSAELTTASDLILPGVVEEPVTILLLGIGTPENEADAIYVVYRGAVLP